VIEPSPQRRQHDRISRDEQQLADSAGLIGVPWRAEGLLARLERHHDIGRRERAAGEEFARLFRLGHLDPLRAADFLRETGPTSPMGFPGGERARRKVGAALDALGGDGSLSASCVWFILGCEMSMREWALRQQSNGRRIGREAAKGTLLGSLGVLVKHFRL
jgi:hypothetical protein